MSNGSVSEDWLGCLMGVRAPWWVIGASAPEGDVEGFVEVEVGHVGGPLACPECGRRAEGQVPEARRPEHPRAMGRQGQPLHRLVRGGHH